MFESLATDREGYTKHVASGSSDRTEEEADSQWLLVGFWLTTVVWWTQKKE